ncbi:MAG: diguanylate cyclase [Acutalibacter sp.]
MIDLKDFQPVNDTFGHQEGDRLVRRVAGVLEAQTTEKDLGRRVLGGSGSSPVKASVSDDTQRSCEKTSRLALPETDPSPSAAVWGARG